MPARFAVYYAPAPGSGLDRFGSAWLGRDARTGEVLEQPAIEGLTPERQRVITEDARRYGFHATLKPPFALAPGRSSAELRDALAAFAAARAPFAIPPLTLAAIGGFLALVPSARSEPLQSLADAAVRELDGFRAPPTADELARRRKARLTPGQETNSTAGGTPMSSRNTGST